MANEVIILIKAKNETKGVITEVNKDFNDLGKTAGGTAKEIRKLGDDSDDTAKKQAKVAGTAREVTREVGKEADKVDDLGRKLRRVSTGTYNVKVDVDQDGRISKALTKVDDKIIGLVATAAGAAEKIGGKFVEILPGAIGGAFQAAGPIVQTAMVAIGAIIVAALASFVSAGISAGILAGLGGGVIGLGLASAFKSDKIDEILNGKKVVTRSALNAKGDKTPNFGDDQESREGGIIPKIKDAFTKFGEPFVDPLARALDKVNEALDRIAPKAAEISQKFAPLVDTLAPALMEMAERAWPGIESALNASLPLFDTLAALLPSIGEAINLFFQTIADHGPAANQAFGQIIAIVGTLIVALAQVIGLLLRAYENFMRLKDALNNSAFGSFLLGPINAVLRLISLLGDALFKKNQLEGVSGQARTLGSGPPAGISTGALRRASGGIAGGLTQVAERGGELIKLPQGSMVYASGQSTHMMQTGQVGGGTSKIAVEIRVTGNGGAGSAIAEWFMGAQRSGEVQILATAVV